jgi:CHAD domain-containing protein
VARSLLGLPAGQAAGEYLRHLCKQADAACARLADPGDTEALHDFRVAIRRSRTWVRAYHLYLPIDKPLQKRLRDLARRTNAARDAEVTIDVLQGFEHDMSTAQRVGLNWLIARFEHDRRQAYADILQHVPQVWPALVRDLRHALKHEEPEAPTDFSRLAFELAASAEAELAQRLTAIGSLRDIEAIHQARIAAKRLRYLLEPFREDVKGVREAVKRLTALQDAIGELHDGHVLLQKLAAAVEEAATERARHLFELTLTDPDAAHRAVRDGHREQPGLLALAGRLAALQQQRFADVQAQYLGSHLRPFLADVDLQIARIAG